MILDEIGVALNEVPNRISISGHTDATPYSSGVRGYSNWELSADRANSTRRELITAGMDEGKVLRVVGLASSVLFNKDDPLDPVNRRISIIVLNKRAELTASQDGGAIDAEKLEQSGTDTKAENAEAGPAGSAAPAPVNGEAGGR